jgi:hypothetical protein
MERKKVNVIQLAGKLLTIPELTRRFMRTMFTQPLRKDLLDQWALGNRLKGPRPLT